MLSNNCPMGKLYCDTCQYSTTGGCIYPRNVSFSITKEESDALWERTRQELMSLSKETLVEIIMGRKGCYC